MRIRIITKYPSLHSLALEMRMIPIQTRLSVLELGHDCVKWRSCAIVCERLILLSISNQTFNAIIYLLFCAFNGPPSPRSGPSQAIPTLPVRSAQGQSLSRCSIGALAGRMDVDGLDWAYPCPHPGPCPGPPGQRRQGRRGVVIYTFSLRKSDLCKSASSSVFSGSLHCLESSSKNF